MAAALETVPAPRAIRSSDLTRCRVLAERFAVRHGLEVIHDRRLREYDFGAWEGLLWSEIPRTDSERWISDLWSNAPPGGEKFAALYARVRAALADCDEGSLVICHAGVIRAAKMILLGRTFDQVLSEKIPFCTPIPLVREAA